MGGAASVERRRAGDADDHTAAADALEGCPSAWFDQPSQRWSRSKPALADDAGLVDGDRLAETAADAGWAGSLEGFASSRGFVQLFGRWATADTAVAAVKAALGSLVRPASVEEIVEMTGRSVDDVRQATRSCKTIIARGDGRWATCTDAGFSDFVAAVRKTRDEVGLVDLPSIEVAAAAGGWTDRIDWFAEVCGYQRLHASRDEAHPAGSGEGCSGCSGRRRHRFRDIAQAAQMTDKAVARVVTGCPSTRFDQTSRCWVAAHRRRPAARGSCAAASGCVAASSRQLCGRADRHSPCPQTQSRQPETG